MTYYPITWPWARLVTAPYQKGAGGPSFSPTDVTGLQLWLDADDLTTLFQDDAKTTPVTSDNDPVGAWADKSGNGNDALQSSPAQRMIYKTPIQNGLPILRGNGTKELFDVASISLSHPTTVFIVGLRNVSGDYFFDGNTDTNRMIIGAGTDDFGIYAGTWLRQTWSDAGAFHVYRLLFNGVSSVVAVDGQAELTGTTGTQTAPPGLKIGSSWNENFSMNGDFAELLVYNNEVSAGDITSITNYLADKWGVAI